MWSADGSTFALEDAEHRIYVGSLNNAPVVLPGRYLVPALSPSGRQLAAKKLGDGEHLFDQIANSPGIVLRDLLTDDERVIVSGDVYAPFFAGETLLGFGSGGNNKVPSLYLTDLSNERIIQLTNRAGDSSTPDAFPVAPPILSSDSKQLNVTTIEDGTEKSHALLLPDFTVQSAQDLNHDASVVKGESQSDRPYELDQSGDMNIAATGKVLFQRPLASYDGIYNFYDHSGRDWGCGSLRYSGHRGTDFKANTGSPVYAAAQGSLYYRYDGCADTGYFGSGCGGGFGNHARVEHADGRVTIYAHLKKGTVIGYAGVSCGRYIGSSASSGSSSTPHLHFELRSSRDASAVRIDPYYGSCDSTDTRDWIQHSSYPSGNSWHTCLPSWFFNSDGNREGWITTNAAAITVSGGFLFIDPGAGDFYTASPVIGVIAASNHYIQFRMASNAADRRGKIYFKTRVENYYSEDKSITFNVNNCALCGNAPFYVYSVYVGGHPKWANTITGIRIDPAENGTGGTNRDSVGIDYIRVTTTP